MMSITIRDNIQTRNNYFRYETKSNQRQQQQQHNSGNKNVDEVEIFHSELW